MLVLEGQRVLLSRVLVLEGVSFRGKGINVWILIESVVRAMFAVRKRKI